MRVKNFDIAERIYHLSLEIKHLVEENKISKKVVIEDFKDWINGEFHKEKEYEDN